MSRNHVVAILGLSITFLAGAGSLWFISTDEQERLLLIFLGVFCGALVRTLWSILLLPFVFILGLFCVAFVRLIWLGVQGGFGGIPSVLGFAQYVNLSTLGQLAIAVGYLTFFYGARMFIMAIPTFAGTFLGKGIEWAYRRRLKKHVHSAPFS